MGFQLTTKARAAANSVSKQPNIVLVINGVSTKFGSAQILKLIRIGDPGLLIDGSWVIGGSKPLSDQQEAISFENSTTSIKQQMEIDKGRGSSISSLEIGLIDFDNRISELISPGVEIEDLLGEKCSVFIGFAETTNFPDDYIRIFRGIVDDITSGAGLIKINIASPEQKKKASIFQKVDTALTSAITDSQTTIPLASTTNLLQPVLGPDGTYDAGFFSYVRIDDEIIRYTGISALNLTGCTRAMLGTINTAHDSGASVSSFYRVTGDAIEVALKIMMSKQGNFEEDVPVSSLVRFSDSSEIANAIVFNTTDVEEEYGIVVGDYCTVSSAVNGANDFTLRQITAIGKPSTGGSYIVVGGSPLVVELSSTALIDFRSQYDTLPSGLGLGGDEVDVNEHLRIRQLFLSNFEYDFYLKDTIENGREWLEQEVYKPCGAYSLNRKAKSSLGYFVGPIPSESTVTLGEANIVNPDKLKIRRTTNKNFANTIVYKYETDVLEEKFLRGTIYQSATSLNRVKVGQRSLLIESTGMRQSLQAETVSAQAAGRKLSRFKFGAEFLDGVQVRFGDGYAIELGDIILLDPANLSLTNTETGTREKPSKLYEVANITKDFKSGKVTLDLIDTNFDGSGRYALIGPSSKIGAGISQTQFTIYNGFPNSPYGSNEGEKWQRFITATSKPVVKVRSADFTTRYAQAAISSVVGNTVTVSTALGFTPQPNDVMELAQYSADGVTDQIKLLYAHMRDTAFPDGGAQYLLL